MAYASIYDLTTGVFTGAQLDVPASLLAAYLPPNCAALPGRHDHKRVRVDVGTGAVVDYIPPKPGDTALTAYVWDAQAQAWAAQDTDAAVAQQVRAMRARLLAECDWVGLRAADIGPQPGDEDWATYRAALRDVPEQPGFPRQVVWPTAPGAAP